MSDQETSGVTEAAPVQADAVECQKLLAEINAVKALIRELDAKNRAGRPYKALKNIEAGKTLLEDCKGTLKALRESAKAASNEGEPSSNNAAASGSPEADGESDMASKRTKTKSAKANARKPVKGKTAAKSVAKPRGPQAESAAGRIADYMLKHKSATPEALAKAAGGIPLDKLPSRVRAAAVDHLGKPISKVEGKFVLGKAS